MSNFEECSEEWERREGQQRFIRRIDDKCWISVLHRMTGFGYMEWETALVFVSEVDRDCMIIGGDRRDELDEMPKEQLREWYAANIDGNRNSFETILHELKKQCA